MKKKIGIIGGAGYTAGELLRILINHPEVEIGFVHSTSNAGQPVTAVHGGLLGETDLVFSETHPLNEVDILFLCSAHGHSRGRIAGSRSVANPGCFATALQLSLVPLAAAGLLPDGEINITALTGSTGAGVKPGATTHFSWRNDNVSVYKPFTHQHLKEIGMTLARLQPGNKSRINFIPMRGDFARGIFAVTTLDCPLSEEEGTKLYKDYYADAPFAVVNDNPIDLKQAVNTNKAVIHVEKHEGKLLVTCAEDNLLKGASGQAVQNMNIMLGLDQRTGLRLKPSAF